MTDAEARAGSACGSEAGDGDSLGANAVRIADYVTSRTFSRNAANSAASRARDDEDDAEREEEEDEVENGTSEQPRHRHRRHHRGPGTESGGGASKPRTSDYESSDSPNSSDHCEDLPSPSEPLSRYDEPEIAALTQTPVINAELDEDQDRLVKQPDDAAEVVVIVDSVISSFKKLTFKLAKKLGKGKSLKIQIHH